MEGFWCVLVCSGVFICITHVVLSLISPAGERAPGTGHGFKRGYGATSKYKVQQRGKLLFGKI